MKQLQTTSGEALMSKPLQPMNFAVDTLLSQGLHILAGSPKAGKSWLALWLAVTVAKGEAVWKMPVKQGTTLYLCLEDSQLRIQNRLFEITDDAPANVHFCTECSTLGHRLEEQLENFASEYPDTVLVIIDTLQIVGFRGEYSEPEIGWIGEASQGLLQLGKHLEQDADLPPLPVDGYEGILTISRSRSAVPGKGIVEGTTKNGCSRTIYMSEDMMNLVRSYCYDKRQEALDGGFPFSDYLFTNERGELMHPDTFTKYLRRLYDENGFPREYHLHTLRRYFVSTMLHNGVDKQTVAELAGHGDTGFLERTYCHPQMQLKQKAANQYTQNVFFGRSVTNVASA